jgi:ubiquitin carboxyl-terminal hydrolase L5
MSNEWCTIESDPGVFSSLIEGLGVKDISVEEIITMHDREYLSQLEPIHGFIFLFRWDNQKPYKPDRMNLTVPELFFAKQVIKDNCATQALLSVLLNNTHKIDIGPKLSTFREFSMNLDPYLRGDTIGQSEHIRKVHNSFAKPDGFLFVHDPKDKRKGKKEDAFHFVAYTKEQNSQKVYEIDGLREGPIFLGSPTPESDWIDIVVKEVQDRMNHYASNEIRFTLLAVVDSPRKAIQKNIDDLSTKITKGLRLINKSPNKEDLLKSINFDISKFVQEVNDEQSIEEEVDLNALTSQLNSFYSELMFNEERMKEEELKKKKQNKENQRRKHNYIPFIFELLRQGVKGGILQESYEKACKK